MYYFTNYSGYGFDTPTNISYGQTTPVKKLPTPTIQTYRHVPTQTQTTQTYSSSSSSTNTNRYNSFYQQPTRPVHQPITT